MFSVPETASALDPFCFRMILNFLFTRGVYIFPSPQRSHRFSVEQRTWPTQRVRAHNLDTRHCRNSPRKPAHVFLLIQNRIKDLTPITLLRGPRPEFFIENRYLLIFYENFFPASGMIEEDGRRIHTLQALHTKNTCFDQVLSKY